MPLDINQYSKITSKIAIYAAISQQFPRLLKFYSFNSREVARELIDSILLPTDRAYSHIAKDMVQKIRFAMAAPGT